MVTPKRILVIGLSNIGDAILMSPVIERLHRRYPQASLTLLVGERAEPLFHHDPRINRLVCVDEFEGLWGRLRLAGLVWNAQPDLLIDLRKTALSLVWRPWRVLRYVWPVPRHVTHMKDRHLWRLQAQGSGLPGPDMCPTEVGAGPPRALAGAGRAQGNGPQPTAQSPERPSIWIAQEDLDSVNRLMSRWGLDPRRRLVVVSPGARSHIKRWYPDRFARLADRLIDEGDVEVVFTGEPEEGPLVTEILGAMRHRAHNAVGATTIRQLAGLMRRASLVITNDSAALHVACAMDVPVLALFGPTDPRKYGPTGQHDRVIQRRLFCVPCEQALCRFNHECMRFISVEDVYAAAVEILQQTANSRQHTEAGKP